MRQSRREALIRALRAVWRGVWLGLLLAGSTPSQAIVQLVKAGDTGTPIKFLLVDSGTGLLGQTGQTGAAIGTKVGCVAGQAGNIAITVQFSGAGVTGGFMNGGGSVAEAGNGLYDYYPAASEVASTGVLAIQAVCIGCVTQTYSEQIVGFDPRNGVNLGLSALPGVAPNAAGGLLTVGAGAGQLNPDGGGRLPSSGVFNGVSLESAPVNWHLEAIDGQGRLQLTAGEHTQIGSGDLPVGLNLPLPASPAVGSLYGLIRSGLSGNVPQSGDSFARLGAPAGISVSADIAATQTAVNASAASVLASVVDGTLTVKQVLALSEAFANGAFTVTRAVSAPWTITVQYLRADGATPLATQVTTYTDSTFSKAQSRAKPVFLNLP